MFDRFLITGATGNLGRVLTSKLLALGTPVRALVQRGDPAERVLPQGTDVCYGDLCDRASLRKFFRDAGDRSCLIHSAGMITIASRPPSRLWQVNVEGTKTLLELAREQAVARTVYVSSVHALPVLKKGCVITETDSFSPKAVRGHYAKTKAVASALALQAHRDGLNVSIVHPSGILCPSDTGRGNISAAIRRFLEGRLPIAVQGGYDFVDVRDVADGILACAEIGRSGESYLLTGHYATLRDILDHVQCRCGGKKPHYLPIWCVQAISPFCELFQVLKRESLFLTPYSVYTLGSNAVFSHRKATEQLGFSPRPLFDTLDDLIAAIGKASACPV